MQPGSHPRSFCRGRPARARCPRVVSTRPRGRKIRSWRRRTEFPLKGVGPAGPLAGPRSCPGRDEGQGEGRGEGSEGPVPATPWPEPRWRGLPPALTPPPGGSGVDRTETGRWGRTCRLWGARFLQTRQHRNMKSRVGFRCGRRPGVGCPPGTWGRPRARTRGQPDVAPDPTSLCEGHLDAWTPAVGAPGSAAPGRGARSSECAAELPSPDRGTRDGPRGRSHGHPGSPAPARPRFACASPFGLRRSRGRVLRRGAPARPPRSTFLETEFNAAGRALSVHEAGLHEEEVSWVWGDFEPRSSFLLRGSGTGTSKGRSTRL